MRFLRTTFVLAALFAIAVGTGSGQEKGSTPKARGQLPQNWGKLGLSDDQKTKIYEIQTKYHGKIDDLNKQIADLKEKMRKDEEGVLTDAQKARLREILAGKGPADDKKKDDK